MKCSVFISVLFAAAFLTGCKTSKPEALGNLPQTLDARSFYLPDAAASRIVSITTNGLVAATVLVQTHRVAVKETGPTETIDKFGEVYAFSPNFFAVHRAEPTRIRFWNLQPDDTHTFMLIDPRSQVLLKILLPPLKETSYIFTFHEEGLFNFLCTMHPTPMTGQILVLPPRST